jgi:DNA-binding XRE family transcriptional regulator
MTRMNSDTGRARTSRFAHPGHQLDAPLLSSQVPGVPMAPACCVLPARIVILDAELLCNVRRAAGLSQERLARESGVSLTTIRRLERESHPRCHFQTRYLLATCLDADPLAITATFT